MKKFKILFIFLLVCRSILAQQTNTKIPIVGRLTDSISGQAVSFATVVLTDASKKNIMSGISDTTGHFNLNASKGDYIISIITTEYKKIQIPISVKDTSRQFSVGTVSLSKNSNQLNEVVISAQRVLVKQEIDRLTYDVQADPDNRSLNVFDMLRKVPLISMTADDGLLIKGSSNFKILIDGKPSSLVVRNPKDILKSIPATNIDKIEVITTPPAKYEADGIGGILNIVMKRNLGNGYNGSASANYGKLLSTTNGSVSIRSGKIGFSGMVGNSWENMPLTIFQKSLTSFTPVKSSIEQNGTNGYNGRTSFGNIFVSYEIDSLNLLTASFSASKNYSERTSYQITNIYDHSHALNQSYIVDNQRHGTDLGLDYSINYQLGFKKKKDQNLTGSFRHIRYENEQNILSSATRTNNSVGHDEHRNNFGSQENTFQFDYIHPVKKWNIEGGVKIIDRDNFSNTLARYHDFAKGDFVSDESVNDINYNQTVSSLYNSVRIKLKKWGIRAGLRMEATAVKGVSVPSGTRIEQRYSHIFPSIAVQHNFKNLNSITGGYTQRIQRPGIWQINPFVDKSNSRFQLTGNPELLSVLNHNISLGFSSYKKSSVNFAVSYSFARNTIQSVISYLADTVSMASYHNLGKNRNLNLSFNISHPISKHWTFTANGTLAYITLQGQIYDDKLKNTGMQSFAYSYITYRFKDWRASLNAGFYSPTIVLQGTSNSYYYSAGSISKEVLKKKGTISASISNPFTKYRTIETVLNTTNFQQHSINFNYFRNYNLSFYYRFGKLQKPISKNKRGISNDDIKSGVQSN